LELDEQGLARMGRGLGPPGRPTAGNEIARSTGDDRYREPQGRKLGPRDRDEEEQKQEGGEPGEAAPLGGAALELGPDAGADGGVVGGVEGFVVGVAENFLPVRLWIHGFLRK
jgi:hypothetical protein